jgi:hypothetical protein
MRFNLPKEFNNDSDRNPVTQKIDLVGGDADLERPTTLHFIEGTLEVVELEFVGHHSFGLDFATVEICDGTREAVSLRERANDLPEGCFSTKYAQLMKKTAP